MIHHSSDDSFVIRYMKKRKSISQFDHQSFRLEEYVFFCFKDDTEFLFP